MVGILQLSDQELKTTMINMLRDLMDKVDNVHARTNGQYKQRNGNSKKKPKKILKIKNTVTEIFFKVPLISLLVDWTWLRKGS